MANELGCITLTGTYLFVIPDTISSGVELILKYTPSISQLFFPSSPSQQSSPEDPETVSAMISPTNPDRQIEKQVATSKGKQHWNSKQIDDFVHKLGFLDIEKKCEDKIKNFLHVNEVRMHLDSYQCTLQW